MHSKHYIFVPADIILMTPFFGFPVLCLFLDCWNTHLFESKKLNKLLTTGYPLPVASNYLFTYSEDISPILIHYIFV